MVSRRAFLGGLSSVAAACIPASRSCGLELRPAILEDARPGLRVTASRKDVLYGSAASTLQLADKEFATALAREAAILVPEYEMKRGVVEVARGQIDLSACDRILAFAKLNDMAFRGHPLLWHKRNPAWLEEAVRNSRDETLITSYIEKVAGHFRGRVHSWDVVNEAIAPEDGRKDSLRRTFWLETFGPRYIDLAYHAARSADPAAMLVYNDWGCELGAPANDRFRAATLDFLEQAVARHVPIDALGLQGHMRAFGTPVDQAKLRNFLTKVRTMGLQILVTEHDVEDSGGPLEIMLRDRAVADASRRFLDVVIDAGASAILTWGLSDRFLDSPGWGANLAGYQPRMLPLDRELYRKPMWHAMADALTTS